MNEREKINQELDEARQVMRELIAGLDAHEEIYPGWTVKELIAHVTGWDDAVISALEAHKSGGPPSRMAERGIDAYNERTVSERSTLDLVHILREWEFTRERVKQLILDLPEDRWQTRLTLPWGGAGSVQGFLRIFSHHEREHAEEIASHRASQSS